MPPRLWKAGKAVICNQRVVIDALAINESHEASPRPARRCLRRAQRETAIRITHHRPRIVAQKLGSRRTNHHFA